MILLRGADGEGVGASTGGMPRPWPRVGLVSITASAWSIIVLIAVTPAPLA